MYQRDNLFSIALYETEIPLNLGAIMRTAACFAIKLHIIEPLGFIFNNKKDLGRSVLDYNPIYEKYSSWQDFLEKNSSKRKILFTPHTSLKMNEFSYLKDDILIFGRESNGMELNNMSFCDALVKIDMNEKCRSLNLAASVAIGTTHVYNSLCKNLFL